MEKLFILQSIGGEDCEGRRVRGKGKGLSCHNYQLAKLRQTNLDLLKRGFNYFVYVNFSSILLNTKHLITNAAAVATMTTRRFHCCSRHRAKAERPFLLSLERKKIFLNNFKSKQKTDH